MCPEVIEITDTATDAFGYELRPGDRVSLVMDEVVEGMVLDVLPARRIAERNYDAQVTVRFANGEQRTFTGELLRLAMYRWVVNDLKREAAYMPPMAHPQGA